MFFFKPILRIGKMLAATIMLVALIGCSPEASSSAEVSASVNANPSVEPESSSSEGTPDPVPVAPKAGTTEIFNHLGLSLEVTNVHTIRKDAIFDGMEMCEYDIYEVYPGAIVTVINADMSDPTYYEDKMPHAQWGFLTSPDERTYIIDGMDPVDITPDLVGVYNLEASIYVLRFEIYDKNGNT